MESFLESLSTEVRRVLLAAGWQPGRRVDTAGWRTQLEAAGFAMHDAAERSLGAAPCALPQARSADGPDHREYGGLQGGTHGAGHFHGRHVREGARSGSEPAYTWMLVVFTAVTNLTDGVTKVALPLVATSLTTSPALVSGVWISLSLPWLLVALHVGVLVDRADRRRLLWLSNAMRIAVVLSLSTVVATHAVSLPMLYGGAMVLGVAEVIALTSAAAMIPDAVAPAGRDRANTWVTGAETLCNEFAGPFLGGLLVAASASIALGASTFGYLIAMATLPLLVGRFKVARAAGEPIPSVSKQVGEGLRFLWHQRLLRLLTLTVTVLVTCWAAWYALMPLVATKRWGLSPTGYGALVGALGLGGLVGTLSVSTANRLFGRRWVMFANVFLTASMVAVPAVTANVWAAGAAAFLGGMGGTLWVVNSRSISQRLVSAEMMGRYNSVARLSSWGPLALGAALAGALAQWLGYRPAFGVFAVATTVVIIPFLRTFTPAVLAEVESGMPVR